MMGLLNSEKDRERRRRADMEHDLALLRRDVEKRSLPGAPHWHDCHLDPGHRDCAILVLLDEVDRLRGELQNWRGGDVITRVEHDAEVERMRSIILWARKELAAQWQPYETASSGAPDDTRSGTNGPETGETAPDRGDAALHISDGAPDSVKETLHPNGYKPGASKADRPEEV